MEIGADGARVNEMRDEVSGECEWAMVPCTIVGT